MGVDGDIVENIVLLDVNEVYVSDDRERGLNKVKIKSLVESISKHGQLQPIIIDKMGNLIAGNHRLEACKSLDIKVQAKVIDEINEDKIKLIEIDENLIRTELTLTQLERHLAKRKEIYTRLYPETKRGGKAKEDGAKTFVEDTAEKTGMNPKTVQRIIRRGENASEDLQEARDNGDISNADMDDIIKETGKDHEAQADKLKALLAQKSEKPKEEKSKKEKNPLGETDNLPIDLEYYKGLEAELVTLKEQLKAKDKELTMLKMQNSKLAGRIEKAKLKYPDIKI